MSQDELAFERYLKRCKELHEEWHPGTKYEQDKFKDFALQKWNGASDTEKDSFREKVKKTGFQAPFSQNRIPTGPATEPFRTSQTPFATFSTGKYFLTSEKKSENVKEKEVHVRFLLETDTNLFRKRTDQLSKPIQMFLNFLERNTYTIFYVMECLLDM